jgi:membrane-associated phospholipid phosphatase
MTDRLQDFGPVKWRRTLGGKVRAAFSVLRRPPRGRVASRWTPAQTGMAAILALVLVVATMYALDLWAIVQARRLPRELIVAVQKFTRLGESGWFLWPAGVVVLALVAIDTPLQPRFARAVIAAFAVRLTFVFVAIGLPSLFTTIVKHLIGRGRPFVGPDVFTYEPFSWPARWGSMPSGHATTAFAALVAIGAIVPPARALLWIYAVMIALSRVIITAHHPSDVVAGAFVGVAGALLVRDWFADRRLCFRVTADGSAVAMPGPSLRRIIKSVARRAQSA